MDREIYLGACVTLLAALLYMFMGARVGILRGRHDVKAPATGGHPLFERAYRVHLNTAEQYIAFLPLLWLATALFHVVYWLPTAFGTLFLLARIVYMRLYMRAPESRLPGAFLTLFSNLGLAVLAAIGLAQAWPW
jgi:glutathione S-transferase